MKICLNMIVKNEAAIIERCIRSLAPHVDYYVIIDTGSTDDTADIIERVMQEYGVRGKIHQQPFVNFEFTRNAALALAQAETENFDYILLCDADMELKSDVHGWKNQLTGDAVSLNQQSSNLFYHNVRLIKKGFPARYVGVTHEYLDTSGGQVQHLEKPYYLDHCCGSSRAEKFERDERLLKEELRRNPTDARTCFYLANTYFDYWHNDEAEVYYQKRIELGGWKDEVFYSQFRLGQISMRRYDSEKQEMDWVAAVNFFLEAYNTDPSRAEPLYELANFYNKQKKHALAHLYANVGMGIKRRPQALFVDTDVHIWKLEDELSIALYWMGRTSEARAHMLDVLWKAPESEIDRIKRNISFTGDLPTSKNREPKPRMEASER